MSTVGSPMMSTVGGSSMMSTVGSPMMSTVGGSPMMSTVGSPMMSTVGSYQGSTVGSEGPNSEKSMVASMANTDEYVSDVSSISMPSVKSLAASSIDVDRMYEEYYASSTASSVSHLN